MKIFTAILLAIAWYIAANPHKAHPQSPNLVVTAPATPGYPTGQAPNLTISSDSTAPWKCFTVSGGSPGSYNVVWAESNGTSGGIFFGSIATSGSGAPAPGPAPAPTPTDLPIATLTTAVSAAVAGVDQATAVKVADTYEAIAKSVDSGVIVSPLQLQLATGTQLLANFNVAELASLKNVTAAVNGWMDAQQCSGKLSGDRIDRYAAVYHAIARALKPGMLVPTPKPGSQKPGSPATGDSPAASKTVNSTSAAKADPDTARSAGTTGQLPEKSPCADGHCKMPMRYRGRR